MNEGHHDFRTVRLSCGHTNIFSPPPFRGDEVWCYNCANFSICLEGSLPKSENEWWVWRLECLDCSYARFGRALGVLKTKGMTHLLRNGHRLRIIDRSRAVKHSFEPETGTAD